MDFTLHFTVILLILSFFFYYILVGRKARNTKKKQAPEVDGGLPIIGHLHQFGSDQVLHQALGALSDKYGRAYTIRLGSRRTMVLSRWEEAKECFTTNDRALASRPLMAASKHMGYNFALFGFSPYGEYWREMRKIATLQLLKNPRVEVLKDVWESEIHEGVKVLHNQCGARTALVNLTQWSADIMINVMVRMIVGKRYFAFSGEYVESQVRRFQYALRRFVELAGALVVSDAIPSLWWFDYQGIEKEMKQIAKELDVVLQQWLDEHRRDRGCVQGKVEDDHDLYHKMLSLEDKGHLSNYQYSADTCIKATCLEVMVDGFETTAGTLVWAIALLMNNPKTLRKAQEELDKVVGRERLVDDSDISKLPYLQSVVKETLRLYPAAPLLAPREATEDCTVAGYHISKGTQVLVNAWKMHRDPRVWDKPSNFRPERFIMEKAYMDIKGQHYELLPFSSGRRSCPGGSLAIKLLQLSLARLLHGFELVNPSDKPVDMTENPSLSISKANPVEILLTPRTF